MKIDELENIKYGDAVELTTYKNKKIVGLVDHIMIFGDIDMPSNDRKTKDILFQFITSGEGCLYLDGNEILLSEIKSIKHIEEIGDV